MNTDKQYRKLRELHDAITRAIVLFTLAIYLGVFVAVYTAHVGAF